MYAYNYVTWTGGANSYETCDLTDRAPQYVGACSARTTCNTVSLLPALLVAASRQAHSVQLEGLLCKSSRAAA